MILINVEDRVQRDCDIVIGCRLNFGLLVFYLRLIKIYWLVDKKSVVIIDICNILLIFQGFVKFKREFI